MNVVEDLLRIKMFRENKAECLLARARRDLFCAERSFEDAELKLTEYRNECARREKKLYSELCKKIVHILDVNNVEIDIKIMRNKIDELNKKLLNAEILKDEAKKKERHAQEFHTNAVREREKFDELSRTAQQSHHFDEIALQESEIEELSEVRYLLSKAI